jgi:hypothetical protein
MACPSAKERDVVREAGGVKALVRLVRHTDTSTEAVLLLAAEALRLLMEPAEHLPSFRSQGGVGALIHLCSCAYPDAQAEAASTLQRLATDASNHQSIRDEGILPLVKLMGAGTDAAKVAAKLTLNSIAETHEQPS